MSLLLETGALHSHDFGTTENADQQIVEVVGDAAGEQPEALQSLLAFEDGARTRQLVMGTFPRDDLVFQAPDRFGQLDVALLDRVANAAGVATEHRVDREADRRRDDDGAEELDLRRRRRRQPGGEPPTGHTAGQRYQAEVQSREVGPCRHQSEAEERGERVEAQLRTREDGQSASGDVEDDGDRLDLKRGPAAWVGDVCQKSGDHRERCAGDRDANAGRARVGEQRHQGAQREQWRHPREREPAVRPADVRRHRRRAHTTGGLVIPRS